MEVAVDDEGGLQCMYKSFLGRFSHSESQFGLPVRHRFDSVLWLWLFSNIVNNGQSLTDVKRLNKKIKKSKT